MYVPSTMEYIRYVLYATFVLLGLGICKSARIRNFTMPRESETLGRERATHVKVLTLSSYRVSRQSPLWGRSLMRDTALGSFFGFSASEGTVWQPGNERGAYSTVKFVRFSDIMNNGESFA